MERLTAKGHSGIIAFKNKSENRVNQEIKCMSDYEDAKLAPKGRNAEKMHKQRAF